MTKHYYLNGQMLPATDASLLLGDIGLLRGFGIFDFLAVHGGRPLFLDDHLQRFERSAQGMKMELPHSVAEIKTIIQQLMLANGTFDAGIRLVLTGGYSENSFLPTTPNFFIMDQTFKKPDPQQYQDGVHLLLHRYIRAIPEVKTTNYTVPILMAPRLKEKGAFEVLYHDGEQISECAVSNFFVVMPGNRIVTPKQNILRGITRQHVLEVAKFTNFTSEEGELSLADLAVAQEAFVSSTTKGILPVIQIDDQKIGDGKVGPVSQELMAYWEDYVEQYLNEVGFEV